MKITAISVSSANGRLTRRNEPDIHLWTSKEDAEFFSLKRSESRLIVMGSGTYEAEKSRIKPSKDKLRIVLTTTPNKYLKDKIAGQLEFSSQDPLVLIHRLEKKGYREMLLVGGSKIYSSFLKENLIDEIYLTIEPLIFGTGKPLFAEGEFDALLELVEVRKLNSRGTILLKYKINK